MSDHDESECPYFWMWLLDGLPFPVVCLVIFVLVVAWAFKHA